MSHRIRMMLLGVIVLVTGLAATTAAQASRSVTVSSRNIGASGVLTLNDDRLICDVLIALTVTPSTTISKVAGTAFGTAGNGYIRNCSGPVAPSAPNNTGTILGASLTYVSFSGSLPSPTRINIQSTDAGFLVNTLAGSCLYRASAANPLTGVSLDFNGGSPNTSTGATFTNDNIARASGSILCPTTGAIRGTLRTLPTAPTLTLN